MSDDELPPVDQDLVRRGIVSDDELSPVRRRTKRRRRHKPVAPQDHDGGEVLQSAEGRDGIPRWPSSHPEGNELAVESMRQVDANCYHR